MPTYDYGCEECKHEWETIHGINDEPEKKCPKCGKENAKRLVSAPNFILKGSGWSSDGYGGGSPPV